MSIWDKLKKHAGAQFLDVIQWQESDHDTIVYRFPVFNQAIQDGGKLVVREGQSAVFQSEGKISDSFTAGTYELSSRTKAVWGFFESIKYGLNYPYKGDIFFVNTRQFRNQKWGSPAPFPLRDKKFGLIKLRAFGTFNYRIVDPVKFIREVVGNSGLFGADEINGEIKNRLFDKFRNLAKEGGLSYEELDMQSEEIGAALVERLGGELQEDYGLQLTRFTILNINVDPKDEERIRRVEDIDVFDGRFDRYREMRQLDVMDKVAEKPGAGNPMMDAGVGLAMGQMFGNMMGGQ
jgi:membrane protease subunit (stomatin/prohibitin family)